MSTAAKPKWHEGTITGFDTETTSVDPHTTRIVTAAVVHRIPGQRPNAIDWIIDPGIDIPPEAAAVHGWTRDRVLQTVGGEGLALRVSMSLQTTTVRMTREDALDEVAAQLATAIHVETPIVAANAPYDLTLLEAELHRHDLQPLRHRAGGIRGVIDPMVLNKQWDPYRKTCRRRPGCDPATKAHDCVGCQGGKYDCKRGGDTGCGATDMTLSSLCRHYGVVLTAAHSSSADALAAVRLAARLGQLWPDAGRLKLSTLHGKQVEWRAEQMDGLRRYFDKNGIEHDGCCGEWPIHAACATTETAVA